MDKKLLDALPADCSTRDVARALGLAVRSIQLMVDRGELEAWKTPGGHRRIARDAVLQWLDRRESGVASAPAPLDAPVAMSVPGPGAAAASVGGRLRRRKRVLLIEDSAHFQNLVRLLMAHEFPDVDLCVAEDGIIGLLKAGELQPDVLLVDLLLPGVDGATLISRLRAYPLFQRSHLIVVTSLDAEQRTPFAMALADVPVVHKPHLVQDLPGLLRACMA